MKGKRQPVEAFAVGAVQRRVETGIAEPAARRPGPGDRDVHRGRRRAARRSRPRDRARRRPRDREEPPGRGAAPPAPATCRRSRSRATRTRRRRRTPRSGGCSTTCSGCPRPRRPRRSRSGCASIVEEQCPELMPWLPLLGHAARRRPPRHARDRGARARVPARARARGHGDLPRPGAAEPRRSSLLEDVHWMDEASCAVLRIIVENLARPAHARAARRRRNVETGFVGPGAAARPHAAARAADRRAGRRRARRRDRGLAAAAARGRDAGRARGRQPAVPRRAARGRGAAGDVDSLPDSIDAVITAQIDRLPTEQRRLLRYAAVLGHTFRVDELDALIARRDRRRPDEATWRSLDGFLGFVAGDVVRFRHTLMRDTAYEELPVPPPPRAARARRRRDRRRPRRPPREPKPSCSRSTSSTRSASRRRGGTRGSPGSGRATSTPTSKRPSCSSGRSLRRGGSRAPAGRDRGGLGGARRRARARRGLRPGAGRVPAPPGGCAPATRSARRSCC